MLLLLAVVATVVIFQRNLVFFGHVIGKFEEVVNDVFGAQFALVHLLGNVNIVKLFSEIVERQQVIRLNVSLEIIVTANVVFITYSALKGAPAPRPNLESRLCS